MLSVKFQAPILIDEKNLAALLALTGVPAMVEPLVNGAAPKRGRKPRAEAMPPAEPAPAAAGAVEQQASTEPVAPVKTKRGPKPKAQAAPAPEPVPETKKRGPKPKAQAAPATPAGPAPDADELLGRFSTLIDKDFDQAKGLLDQFGVERFSDMKTAEYGAFAAALSEAGV